MGEEGVCKVRVDPSFLMILTRKTNQARVLFFLEPAIPILASTSAFLSFSIPTQSTLKKEKKMYQVTLLLSIVQLFGFSFFLCFETVSLCRPGCPVTQSVDQAGL